MSRRINPPKNAIEETQRLAADGYSIIGIAKHLGVSRDAFKRWCDEDDALQEAFEVGMETERQANGALSCISRRHGYREFESPNTKVDVTVNAPQPLLLVTDHGSDEAWAAKVAEQQPSTVAASRTRLLHRRE